MPEGVHSPMAPRQRIAFALPLACAHAVLQCTPRARTKGRGMLRIRLSASKDAPATGQGQERFARIVTPFSAAGEAITRERHARSTILLQATGCERPVVEAITFHKPLRCRRQGKVSDYRLPFPASPVTCPFLEALCRVLYQCSAFGARTGRALQNGLHAEREQSIVSAIGEGSSGGPRQWINNGFARRHPLPAIGTAMACP